MCKQNYTLIYVKVFKYWQLFRNKHYLICSSNGNVQNLWIKETSKWHVRNYDVWVDKRKQWNFLCTIKSSDKIAKVGSYVGYEGQLECFMTTINYEMLILSKCVWVDGVERHIVLASLRHDTSNTITLFLKHLFQPKA